MLVMNNLSDADILKKVKENFELLKELKQRYGNSLLYDLEVNKLLDLIGKDKVKDWIKEIES